MSDTPSTDPTSAAAAPAAKPSPARAWRDAWQIPLLVIGAGGVAAAIWFGTARKPANDFEGALDQAEKYIEGRDIPVARKILDEVVAPHIAEAPEEFVHRYEALRADFAAEELAERKDASQADHEAVAKLYETALAHGADLDDRQYARYANALEGAKRNSDAIAAAEKAGDHDRARKLEVRFGRKRLEDAFEAARAAGGSRNAAAETDKFFKEHEAFRSLRRISADDRAWAAGLAARLRLASGRVTDATDRLLVELRLAERASQVGDLVSPQEFAQLWYLLGEGFRQQDKFADAEHALDPSWAKRIGVNLDELLVSQPDTGEQALEICEMLVRSNAVDIIVIDSVAALIPKAEIEVEMGDSVVGLQARLMSQAMRKLTGAIAKSECIVIFINQLREKIGVMFGSPETTTGGKALKFYASVRIDIRRIGAIKDGERNIGNRVRAKVVKNKVAPPFREAEFDIMFNEGISTTGDLVDLAVEENIIEKAGSWFAYKTTRIGQGRENAKAFVKENPAMFAEIRQRVIEKRMAANEGTAKKGPAPKDDDGDEDE
jgi:recombination protein RecA